MGLAFSSNSYRYCTWIVIVPYKGALLPGHSLKTETFEFIELIIVTWDLHLQKKLYFFLIDLHYVDNFWELALQPWDIHPQSFCVKCQVKIDLC